MNELSFFNNIGMKLVYQVSYCNLGNDTGFCPENKGSQASTLGFIFSGTLLGFLLSFI